MVKKPFLLASHPAVDPQKTGIMGFSKSGMAGVYAAMDRFNDSYGNKKARFALFYMAFYPPATNTATMKRRMPSRSGSSTVRPMNDYVPIAPCRDDTARLKASGVDVGLPGYAESCHGFAQSLPEKFFLAHAQHAVQSTAAMRVPEKARRSAITRQCIGRRSTT
jgi:hypothetical protein